MTKEELAKLLGISETCIIVINANGNLIYKIYDTSIEKIPLKLWNYHCSLDFWNCRFRESIVTDKIINTKLQFQNCIFEQSWLSKLGNFNREIEFIECFFWQSVNFLKSSFLEKMCFYNSIIKGEAIFNGVEFFYNKVIQEDWFYKYAYCFKKTTFENTADFNRAKFMGSVDFSISKFQDEARFLNAKFNGKSSEKHGVANLFKECIFENKAIFDSASFSEKVDFGISRFEDEASFIDVKFEANSTEDNIVENNFNGSIFYEKISFEKARFQGRVDFRNSSFKDEARFLNVNFLAPITPTHEIFENNFSGITFDKTALFSGSKFHGRVKFSITRFNDEAKFVGVDFLGIVPNEPHNNFAENDFSDSIFEKRVVFAQVVFNGKINFSLSSMTNALFSKVHFQKKCKDEEWLIPSASFKNATFINCYFPESVEFVQCSFIDCNFLLGITKDNEKLGFEKVIFISSIFKGTNNFDDGIFHQNPALTNNIFNGEFKISQNLLKYPYGILEEIIGGEIIFNQTERNPSVWRDLFRQLKSNRIAHHNVIDASELHTQELYARELELKKEAKTIREKIEKWQLWFYRKTSDHHTDLLRAFNSLLCLVFVFGVLSFGAMVWFACYFDKTSSISSLFDMRYLQVIYNSHISLLIHKHPYYTFGINFSFIAIFLSLFWISVSKYSRYFFVFLGYVTSIVLFLISPKLLMPAIGFFTDKREVLDPLSIIGGIYTLLFGFLAYSFIKTARKNSIIPS